MQMIPCPKCNLTMNVLGPEDADWRNDPSVLRDAKMHKNAHRDRMRRFARLGLRPLNVTEREELKTQSQRLICDRVQSHRDAGGEMLIDAYYNCSLAEWEDDDLLLLHPCRDDYAAHLPLESMFPEDVARRLRAKYGPATDVHIDPRSLRWLGP